MLSSLCTLVLPLFALWNCCIKIAKHNTIFNLLIQEFSGEREELWSFLKTVRLRDMSSILHGLASLEITPVGSHFYCRFISHHPGVVERFLRSSRITL